MSCEKRNDRTALLIIYTSLCIVSNRFYPIRVFVIFFTILTSTAVLLLSRGKDFTVVRSLPLFDFVGDIYVDIPA